MTPGNDDEDDSRADASGEIRLPATLIGADGALPERCEIAIVGGGVIGLSIAYHLARKGLSDVVVLERGYLAQGASGRNGGGVRMQWSTEQNVRLMQNLTPMIYAGAVIAGSDISINAFHYGTFVVNGASSSVRIDGALSVAGDAGASGPATQFTVIVYLRPPLLRA